MDAERIVTQRFLAACEQEAWNALPAGWEHIQPETSKLRQSAAVLLRVAEQPDRAAMLALLDEIAGRVAAGGSTTSRCWKGASSSPSPCASTSRRKKS